MLEERRYRLRSSEWLLTGSLLFLLAALLAIAKIKAYQAGEPLKERVITLEISLQGHVKNPGIYPVRRGTALGELIKQARPLKFADLRSLSLKEPILKPLELVIEPLKELLIQVEGAVEHPGQISVSPGTKISDLKKILTLDKEADPAFFRKKRLLQDGECVKIPTRNR